LPVETLSAENAPPSEVKSNSSRLFQNMLTASFAEES
jgi:hypothetical protein